eukprot:CFRG7323T1
MKTAQLAIALGLVATIVSSAPTKDVIGHEEISRKRHLRDDSPQSVEHDRERIGLAPTIVPLARTSDVVRHEEVSLKAKLRDGTPRSVGLSDDRQLTPRSETHMQRVIPGRPRSIEDGHARPRPIPSIERGQAGPPMPQVHAGVLRSIEPGHAGVVRSIGRGEVIRSAERGEIVRSVERGHTPRTDAVGRQPGPAPTRSRSDDPVVVRSIECGQVGRSVERGHTLRTDAVGRQPGPAPTRSRSDDPVVVRSVERGHTPRADAVRRQPAPGPTRSRSDDLLRRARPAIRAQAPYRSESRANSAPGPIQNAVLRVSHKDRTLPVQN